MEHNAIKSALKQPASSVPKAWGVLALTEKYITARTIDRRQDCLLRVLELIQIEKVEYVQIRILNPSAGVGFVSILVDIGCVVEGENASAVLARVVTLHLRLTCLPERESAKLLVLETSANCVLAMPRRGR